MPVPQNQTATDQIRSSTEKSTDRRVANGLLQLLHNLCLNAGPQESLAIGIERRKTELRASARYENLILGHVTCRCMMLPMGNSPRVVWNSESDRWNVPFSARNFREKKNWGISPRMKNPANEIVNELGL